jgi:Terminase small subunit
MLKTKYAIDFSVINHKWTALQLKMLDEYMTRGSYEAAYRHTYNTVNMKDKTIQTNAHAMFQKKFMKEALVLIKAAAMDEVNRRMTDTVIDAAWVLKRVALLANFNIKKFITMSDSGEAVYDFTDATDDDWYCISEYTVDVIPKGKGENAYLVDRVKLKTVDKLKALELVGKHVSIQAFRDQIENTGTVVNVTMTSDEYKKARSEMITEDEC